MVMRNEDENTEEQDNQEEVTQNEPTEDVYEHEFPDLIQDMTGYDHLYLLCKEVRNPSSAWNGSLNPITPRLQYIIDALATQGNAFELVPLERQHSAFNPENVKQDDMKLANVMVHFKGNNPDIPTVIFTAHHDIANPNSENCQDNTASVCNLLHLCALLKEHADNGELEHNVSIGFTDCEEVGGKGVNKLISDIHEGKYGEVQGLIALELTANGTEMWVEGMKAYEGTPLQIRIDSSTEKEVHRVSTPYNESYNVRRAGIPAVCIGTLSPEEIEVVNGRRWGRCDTWALCHSSTDTFERSANKEEMTAFVHTMLNMIDIKKKEQTDEVSEDDSPTYHQVTLDEAIKEAEREEFEANGGSNYSAIPYAPQYLDADDLAALREMGFFGNSRGLPRPKNEE